MKPRVPLCYIFHNWHSIENPFLSNFGFWQSDIYKVLHMIQQIWWHVQNLSATWWPDIDHNTVHFPANMNFQQNFVYEICRSTATGPGDITEWNPVATTRLQHFGGNLAWVVKLIHKVLYQDAMVKLMNRWVNTCIRTKLKLRYAQFGST